MPIAATIGAVGAIGSAGIGAYGASQASRAQADAANNALNFQQGVYNNNQQVFKPYLDLGKNATYSLGALYGFPDANGNATGKSDYSQFTNSPDYGFAYEQGKGATQNLLSAQGNLLSGGGVTALTNFGQGLASQQYGNYFNRLMGLANMGAGAGASLAGTNANMSNSIGNTMQSVGQANASGIVGMTNAISGGVGGVANSLSMPYYANYASSMFNPNRNASSYGQFASGSSTLGFPGAPAANSYLSNPFAQPPTSL